jgi:hypothetical protein
LCFFSWVFARVYLRLKLDVTEGRLSVW